MEKGKFDWSLGEMGSKTTGAKAFLKDHQVDEIVKSLGISPD